MPARTPEECDALFAVNINRGDLEGLVALYEPKASLVQQEGPPLPGPRRFAKASRDSLR